MGTGPERVAVNAFMLDGGAFDRGRLEADDAQAERRSISQALKPLVSSSLMQSRILLRWLLDVAQSFAFGRADPSRNPALIQQIHLAVKVFHQREQGIAVPDLLLAEGRDETPHRPFLKPL